MAVTTAAFPTRWITMPTLKEALLAVAILCFAGADAHAAEIHDGDTGYIANNSIWFRRISKSFSNSAKRGNSFPVRSRSKF
jgi:hypothetical protein